MPMGIPPWIQPADEAGQTAHGFQIGMQLGAQQAAQQLAAEKQRLAQSQEQFYEQQALKEQQLAAQRDARAQAEFGLQAAAAARKSDALLGYQKAVSEGMDPMKAMLQFGPGMGQPVTAVASAARALAPKPQMSPTLVDLGGGVKGVQAGNAFHLLPPTKTSKPVHVGNKLVDPETGDVLFDGDKGKWSKEDTMKWEEASREMLAAQRALATPFISSDPAKAKEAQAAALAAKRDRDAIDAKYATKDAAKPSKRFKWDKAAGRLVPAETSDQPQAVPSGGDSDQGSYDQDGGD